MDNKKNEEPLVDDELLHKSGAEPDEHVLERDLKSDEDVQSDIPDNVSIDELQRRLEEKEDRYVRLYAEFDNYKRRTKMERLDLLNTAGSKTMLALLPVLDDFDRAQKQAAQDEETARVWKSGVGLIVKKMKQTLEAQGLKAMDSDGQPFDSDRHEAVTEIPNPDMKGKVVDTIERGYTLNGKIIRHAKVVVGR